MIKVEFQFSFLFLVIWYYDKDLRTILFFGKVMNFVSNCARGMPWHDPIKGDPSNTSLSLCEMQEAFQRHAFLAP